MTASIAAHNRSTFLTRSYVTGISDASKILQSMFDKTFIELRKSSITWNHVEGTVSSLDETYRECSKSNWDGYGAAPLSEAAYQEAKIFLNSFPLWLPLPEIVPEPTGDIGFEWNVGKNRIFVASVNGTHVIAYAGILGKGNKTHGTEIFDGSTPEKLIQNIKRIYPKVREAR